ncbi:hypothetical protein AAG570_005812 [Ranatra chinensis]|uniref:Cytochrome P450 n=1 Tax=Ranatra chinensis TaxID=642074 RepID=A0ABD0XYI7_9HEMI
MRKTIGEMYDEIYKRFAGCPYVGFYKLCQPALMVRDPELVKTVLIKEFNSFHDNDYHVNPLIDPILGLNPFNAKGDKWKPLRDLVTPSLTVIKVKALVPQIVNVCEELVNYLEREGNQPMEAYELASKYTTDVVGRCAYGVESNSFTNPDNELHQMSKKIFEGSFTSNAAVIFAFYAPKLGEIFKFNYVEMAGHCMTFFLDGFETAAILISFTLFELAANPQVQEKLRHEIQKALTDFRMFKFETIHGLHYLEMVILGKKRFQSLTELQ